MTRLSTEYKAKIGQINERSAKLRTDLAIFKEEMQNRKKLEKELDELE